jgi:hypothetical protein
MMRVRGARTLSVVVSVFVALSIWALAVPAEATIDHDARSTWGANGPVFAVARVGNRIFLGGSFTKLVNPVTGETRPRRNLAALWANGTPITTWRVGTHGAVLALATSSDGKRLYLGGSFDRVNGSGRDHLAAVKVATGELRTRWKPRANDDVLAMDASPDHVYVGGEFTTINGKPRAHVAAVHTIRGRLWAWDPGTNGPVRAIAIAPTGGSVYLGGSFFVIDHVQRHELARVTAKSGTVGKWHPDPAVPVFGIAPTKSRVFVAAGDPDGGNLFAYAVKGSALLWKAHGNGDFHSVTVFDSQVVSGGHFTRVRGKQRVRLASFGRRTGKLKPWNAAATGNDNGVWAVLGVGSSALELGGYFTGINGRPQPGFAEFGAT